MYVASGPFWALAIIGEPKQSATVVAIVPKMKFFLMIFNLF
jgi:hypothetical protein